VRAAGEVDFLGSCQIWIAQGGKEKRSVGLARAPYMVPIDRQAHPPVATTAREEGGREQQLEQRRRLGLPDEAGNPSRAVSGHQRHSEPFRSNPRPISSLPLALLEQ
jgi:hypothetical protein